MPSPVRPAVGTSVGRADQQLETGLLSQGVHRYRYVIAMSAAAEVGRRAAALLRSLPLPIQWTPGLNSAEFNALQERLNIRFADDHRAFLEAGVPVGQAWPNWRHRWFVPQKDPILGWLDAPVQGVLFDVAHDQFWHPDWGLRPSAGNAAVELARTHLRSVPQLLPVFGHRFLPPGAGRPPSAVMSVHQSDVIFYGDDLYEWVAMEFIWSSEERQSYARTPSTTRPVIPFWTDVVNQDWLDE